MWGVMGAWKDVEGRLWKVSSDIQDRKQEEVRKAEKSKVVYWVEMEKLCLGRK